jgi:putative nucleotidyltransferase with HDIG domain
VGADSPEPGAAGGSARGPVPPSAPSPGAGPGLTGLAGLLVRVRALVKSEVFRRAVSLVLLSVGTSLLVVEYVRVPTDDWQPGEVAERDVRASTSFDYVDWDDTYARQRDAEGSVQPVYDYDTTLGPRVQARVTEAFEVARARYSDALMGAKSASRPEASPEELSAIAREFLKVLELSLDPSELDRIISARWSREVETAARELIGLAMRSYVVADANVLPPDGRPVSVFRIMRDGDDELQLEKLDQIHTPEGARSAISLTALENIQDESTRLCAVAVARAAVRPNFSYNQLKTEERRRDARNSVTEVVNRVNRGASIARQGDVLTRQQVEMLNALRNSRSGFGTLGLLLALTALSGVVYVAIYQFAAGQIERYSTRTRDVEAQAVIVLLVLALGRVAVEVSAPFSALMGLGTAPTTFWYLVPFAGGAMLLRILVNSETALVWILVTAALLGVLMDQQVLFCLYFAVSGVTAVGSVAQTRERVGVLRAGLLTGLVNAAMALLLNLVAAHLGEGASLRSAATQPLWDVGFAFLGGLGSGILVLGLVPMFEVMGFVTDYKLLELANLNHPLLRQLMLRAPGTYHHSVTVAQLCEAAAEAIGANALQTRVACYFHDIGKAVQPKYFIENQRGGPNPHDRLPPRTSARIIVAHVVDGLAIGKQYKLPQPVLDGITMHHGTGLIQYFYAKAVEQAAPGSVVDEADFRYAGDLPNSRETGIMMLADKVEAACRTLRDKSPENIRALIQKLVNGAVTDGQLVKCPLTVKELYTIVDAFTDTLLAIYHHRIEYPGVPKRTDLRSAEEPTGPIITLELASPFGAEPTDPRLHTRTDPGFKYGSDTDYESAEHLPIGTRPKGEEGK